MASKIKVLDVTIPGTEKEALAVLKKDVFPVIEPSWVSQDVVIEKLTAGMVNITLLCSLPGDANKQNAIIIRVYGAKGDAHESHDLEFVKMQIGYHAGCFGEVLAAFANGCIYRYSPGRCLTKEELCDPNIMEKCARLLAKFHYVDPSKLPLVDRQGKSFHTEIRQDYYIQKLKEYVQATANGLATVDSGHREMSEKFSKEYREEVAFVETFLKGLDLPCANCHGSFHTNNILYDDDSGKMTFIDYEFSGNGNIAMFDFAYMFNLYRVAAYVHKEKDPVMPETEKVKSTWLRTYLKAKHDIEGRDVDVSTKEMDTWMTMLDLMNGLTWLLIAGRCHNLTTPLPQDNKALSVVLFQIYKDAKAELPALRERYVNLTS